MTNYNNTEDLNSRKEGHCKCPYSTSFCSLFDLVNNFKVTPGGSSRALKCNSIYLIKGPLISFW